MFNRTKLANSREEVNDALCTWIKSQNCFLKPALLIRSMKARDSRASLSYVNEDPVLEALG